jgi:hypothetical protein
MTFDCRNIFKLSFWQGGDTMALLTLSSQSSDLEALIRGVKGGAYCLLLGAGASLGAKNSLGQDPPLGRKLTSILLDACELEPDEFISLSRAYDAARSILGDDKVIQILQDQFSHCVPGWQTLIPTFVWNRIYTLNVDDVLESAYRRAGDKRLQEVLAVNYNDPYRTPDMEYDQVLAIHLHGFVRKPAAGFVFSPTEYAMASNARYTWHTIFSDEFHKYGFIFVGTDFNESDLESYLSARQVQFPEYRPPSFLVVPNATPGLAAAMSTKGIHCVKATAADFFRWLDEQCPGRIRKSDEFFGEHPALGKAEAQFAKHYAVFKRSCVKVSDDLSDIARGPRLKDHDFLGGDESDWNDIFDNNDAVFHVVPQVLSFIEAVDSGSTPSPSVICLVGAPGSGKTTALRRISLDASRRGRSVYYYQSDYGLQLASMTAVLKTLPPNSLFVVDNAALHSVELFDLSEQLVKHGRPIHILTAERTTRYRRLEVESRGSDIARFNVDELPDSDIAVLLVKLREKARLGSLHDKTVEEQVRFFRTDAKRQLLVAMKEATHGRQFDQILDSEYREIQPAEAKRVYEIVSLVHQTGERLGFPEVCRAAKVKPEEFYKWLNTSLHGIVIPRSDRIATRHPVIAQRVIFNFVPPRDRLKMMASVLEAVAPYLNVRRLREHPPEAQLMRRFLDFEVVEDLAQGRDVLIDDFYRSLQPLYEWNSKYWAQRGIFEAKRKNFAAAYSHVKLAVKMDAHPVNVQTYGWVLMEWACDPRISTDEGWHHFREAIRKLDAVALMTDWRDEYPVTTMLNGIAAFAVVRGLGENRELADLFNRIYNTASQHFQASRFESAFQRFIDAKKQSASSKQ